MGQHQTKMLPHSKRNHQQNKKAIDRMGEIFASHTSDKGLIFKKYKVSYNTIAKKKLFKKQAKGLN